MPQIIHFFSGICQKLQALGMARRLAGNKKEVFTSQKGKNPMFFEAQFTLA
jgi:hypothetical protein